MCLSLFEVYFLYSMLNGGHIDSGSFLANHLYSAATSTSGRVVIRGIITPITMSIGFVPSSNNAAPGSKRLKVDTFEKMKFCKMEAIQVCWIFPRNQLMPLLNYECTTLQIRVNLSFLPSDEEVNRAAPLHPPPSSQGVSALSYSTSSTDLD